MPAIFQNIHKQLPFLLLYIAIWYFFFFRPRSGRRTNHALFFDELKAGDKVVTIGGIHGVVRDVEDRALILAIGDNPRSPQFKIQREAISIDVTLQVYPREKKEADKPKEKKAKEEKKA